MAASLGRLAVRGARRVLILERLGLRAATLTTKATGPQKKKKVKDDRVVVAPVDTAGLLRNKTAGQCADPLPAAVCHTGAEASEVSSSDSHIQAAEITSTKRASLLSNKTLLLFPGRDPGPTPLPPPENQPVEALSSTQGIPERSEWSTALGHLSASGAPVGEKSAAEEDSDSSSDSSSDSDEETVPEDAVKTPVEFPRHDSDHCTPARVADWKKVNRGGRVSEPQAKPRPAEASVARDSVGESPTELSKMGREREAQAVRLETIAQRNRASPSSELRAGAKASPRNELRAGAKASSSSELRAGAKASPRNELRAGAKASLSSELHAGASTIVTTPEASSLPKVKSVTQETATSSPPKAWALPAQGGIPGPERESAEELTPESAAPAVTEAPDTPQEPVEEPGEEVLDSSTYKNTQHHEYTPLTFVDLDMEMAKYRLPQPTTGRLTPRH